MPKPVKIFWLLATITTYTTSAFCCYYLPDLWVDVIGPCVTITLLGFVEC
jgi:hypothetical protein